MAPHQKRKVRLRNGRRSVELELGEGHVWVRDGGTTGYPVHDAVKERALFARLLGRYRGGGFQVVDDTGLVTKARTRARRALPTKRRASAR